MLHQRLTLTLQAVLLIGAALAIWEGQWLTASTTLVIVALTLAPVVLGKRLDIYIPPELELLAILFLFASLFLGEVRGYYARFWWWDVMLHTASGFLLGIVGFLLVYLLNEKREIDVDLTPGFVALFAFVFAVGLGALWEIFEFGMDSLFGLEMQKPMLGDPSGLTDTMWDLIVDTVGAAVVALMGWGYLRTPEVDSFVERWIRSFVEGNPRLFGDGGPPPTDPG